MGSDAPNIILNLQNQNSNRKELRAFALVGVILQLCVLLFFVIITYHPTIRHSFRKGDQRVDDYACPLAITGTIVLAIGVFVCGTVVEHSTRETRYKKNEKYEMRIVWIQQKQTVGDQVFEPFATFPDAPREVVTVSRRCDKSKARALEPLTITGICIGLAGFFIQFIGLRGMNSAATLTQLAVIGIMVSIRAWVRRGLALPPRQEKLTSGFELDILAWSLTLLNHSQNQRLGPEVSPTGLEQGVASTNNAKNGETRQRAERGSRDLAQVGSMGTFMNLGNRKHCSWSLWTGGNVDYRPFLKTRLSSDSRAQQVLGTRRGLNRLAQLKGPRTTEAINLVTAMEKVLNVLFPSRLESGVLVWTWPLPVIYSDHESAECSKCYVHIYLILKDRSWVVLTDQLESVLSLCLFTVHKQKESQREEEPSGSDLSDENHDWLRQEAMDSDMCIRLFGSTDAKKMNQLFRDLHMWAPDTFDALAELEEVLDFDDERELEETLGVQDGHSRLLAEHKIRPKFPPICVESHRVVGCGPTSLPSPQHQRQWGFRDVSIDSRPGKRRGILYTSTNDSLEKLYAKDILFSFLFSAAKTLRKPLQSEVTTRETTVKRSMNQQSISLATKEITSVATELVRLGYGTEQEVWTCIITPMSLAGKLPFPEPLFDLARGRAEKMRREHNWRDLTSECLKLWEQTQSHTLNSYIHGYGTALFMERFREVDDKRKLADFENDSMRFHVCRASRKLQSVSRGSKHQPDFFAHLFRLYEKQGRPIQREGIPHLTSTTPQDIFPDYFGITKLHLKVMESHEVDRIRIRDREVWDARNQRDICGWTPLHYCSVKGNLESLSAVLKLGADPNHKDLRGFTPVHYAFQNGGKGPIKMLLKHGGQLEAQGFDGATPMHLAAKHGNLEAIRMGKGPEEAPFKLRDHDGRLPVHWAVIYGRERVVQELKSTVDEPDMFGWTSLHLAALFRESGSSLLQTVFKLSAKREMTDEEGRTALILACDRGNIQAAQQLIEAGADVNATTPNGATALYYAMTNSFRGDRTTLIQALVDQGAKIDAPLKAAHDSTALHLAVHSRNITIVDIFLGALNSLQSEARSLAINMSDNNGETALHVAASLRVVGTMGLLLLAGADPNKKDKKNETPLHYVLRPGEHKKGGCLEMVKMLVEKHANIRAQDRLGRLPLDIAKENRHTDAAEYLKGMSRS